jgi:hypothetical protein
MRKLAPVLALLALASAATPSWGQEQEDLNLAIRRDFGFRSGVRIQGRFTLEASGPADLARVEFLLDQAVIGAAESAPFRFSFSTGSFALGPHSLQAVGTTASGMSVRSPERNVRFVSADEGWAAGIGIAAPLGIGVAAVIAVGVLLPGLVGRRRRVLRRQDTGMPGSAPDSGSEDEEQRLLRSIENSKYLE